jgi:hypothetical protein
MAKKTTQAADSKRRQYLILGVGAALLGILAVIQVPKLLGGGSDSAATQTEATAQAPGVDPATAPAGVAPTSTALGTTPPTTPPAPAPATVAASGGVVAGAALPGVAGAKVDEGQLRSFNLLRPKDPFVQLVSPSGVSVQATGAYGSVSAQVEAERARQRAAAARRKAAQTNVAGPTGTRLYATIAVNDKTAQTKLKARFPSASKQFLLRSLAPTTATVTVVKGPLAKGLTVQLKLGKTTTLLNAKTGQRVTLRLLYTGAEPEQITTVTAKR